MDNRFVQVGIRPAPILEQEKTRRREKRPILSIAVLAVIVLGCLFCNLFIPKDPAYMDFYHVDTAPNGEFLFGTDTMGRDIFSMIWYGGRVSLFIGFFATLISTAVAILFGTVSALAPKWLDNLLMRLTEIFLSIPNLLLVILIQAVLGQANVFSISFVIGMTGWTSIAKVVRTDVRKIQNTEHVIAARCMGAGFFRILWKHLVPKLLSSIMFMVVMNIRSAIVAESTLSFMGIGLPFSTISWGSMLSLAERSLLSGSWWTILIPGIFLTVTILCITDVGNYLQKGGSWRHSNL